MTRRRRHRRHRRRRAGALAVAVGRGNAGFPNRLQGPTWEALAGLTLGRGILARVLWRRVSLLVGRRGGVIGREDDCQGGVECGRIDR
jgi:hypothetical protein